jgi:Zn-dependent peptidase ImmA (M78 family)/DNA-binding XRE family transcriptional regulator
MTNVGCIRLYREQLGFTQEMLGEELGVTRQTIAAWESGEREPSPVHLTDMARVMNVPVALLLGSPVQGINNFQEIFSSLLFRADEPSALTPTVREHLTYKVSEYANLEKLVGESSVLPAQHPLEGYDEEIVEDLSKEVRSWLGIGESAPMGDVISLIESKGLKVIQYQLPDKISGFSAYTDDSGCVIVINKKDCTERKYFTALHELAHLILHRREYRQPQVRTKATDPREKAANHLAGAVLLPKSLIHRELRSYRQQWLPEPLLADIKLRNSVSLRTVLLRAEQIGIITKQQMGQQLGILNKKYGSQNEQPILPEPKRLSRLERLVYTALLKEEEDTITLSRAADILGQKTSEVKHNLQSWNLKGEGEGT